MGLQNSERRRMDLFNDRRKKSDPTDFMNEDELASHNEAMENDPQYRDAMYSERN